MDIAKIRKKFKDSGQKTDSLSVSAESQSENLTGQMKAESLPVMTESPARDRNQEIEPAAEAPAAETIDSTVELLAFTLAREEYAFRIDEIEEILKPPRVTKMPGADPCLSGIASIRGKIIPVIELRKRLSIEIGTGNEDEREKKQRVLIIKGPKGPIGVLVESVIGVVRTPIKCITETPPHLPEAEMRFIKGVAIIDDRFVAIIRTEEAVNI